MLWEVFRRRPAEKVRKNRSSSLGRVCQGDQQAGRGQGEGEEREGQLA